MLRLSCNPVGPHNPSRLTCIQVVNGIGHRIVRLDPGAMSVRLGKDPMMTIITKIHPTTVSASR
jgi:hypothetical protein